MGLTPGDVGQLLQYAWAGTYVNDFLDQGRIKRVYVQGEAEARATPTDIEKWRVRNASGGLVPFSNFAKAPGITARRGFTAITASRRCSCRDRPRRA